MCESFDGQAEGSSKSKVSDFECSLPVNEQILRFEVSMDDSTSMAIVNAIAELVEE